MRALALVLLTLTLAGCAGDAAVAPGIPAPRGVPESAVPRPLPGTAYVLYGWDATRGPQAVLQDLVDHDLPVRAAWTPDPSRPGPCLIQQVSQLIVVLDRRDLRMFGHGFTQDPGQILLGACNPYWLEYAF